MSVSQFDHKRYATSWHWFWPDGDGTVKAYPEIYFGNKFGRSSGSNTGLPSRVSQLANYTLRFSYTENTMAIHGERNIAFESWFHASETISEDNRVAEMMVWLDRTPNFYLDGRHLHDVEIDGSQYELHANTDGEWQFYVFIRSEPLTKGTLHWNSFVQHLLDENLLDLNSYMATIEFGTEIIYGQGSFVVTDYEIDID